MPLALGLVIVAGLTWWWTRASPRDPAAAVPTADLAPAAVGSVPVVAALPAGSAPLPPAGTPLRLVFEGLRRRADGGDARAACRLAAELEQCERVRTQLAQVDDQLRFQQDRLQREANPDQRARLQQGIDRFTGARGQSLLQDAERCDGVPSVSPAERASLWRAAALGGSLPALTQYAVGNAFRTRDTLQLLPQLQVYRYEAEALALQAAQRGSIQATLALAAAYSPNRDSGRRTYLAQVVGADAGKSLALYLQAQRAAAAEGAVPPMRQAFVERRIEGLRRELDADQIARAEAQAARWRQEWAAPQIVGAGGTLSFDGGTSDIEPQACGE